MRSCGAWLVVGGGVAHGSQGLWETLIGLPMPKDSGVSG